MTKYDVKCMSCRTTTKLPREHDGACKTRLRRGKKMLERGGGPHRCTSQIYDFRSQMYADGKIWSGREAYDLMIVVFRQEGKKLEGCCCWNLEGRKERSYGSSNGDGGGPTGALAASGTNLKTPGLFSSRVHPLLSPHFTAISSCSPPRSSNFTSPHQSPSLSDALYVADSLGLRFALQTLRRRGLLLR